MCGSPPLLEAEAEAGDVPRRRRILGVGHTIMPSFAHFPKMEKAEAAHESVSRFRVYK